jgi:hypothetical protein
VVSLFEESVVVVSLFEESVVVSLFESLWWCRCLRSPVVVLFEESIKLILYYII